jgi:hypothetical protein
VDTYGVLPYGNQRTVVAQQGLKLLSLLFPAVLHVIDQGNGLRSQVLRTR